MAERSGSSPLRRGVGILLALVLTLALAACNPPRTTLGGGGSKTAPPTAVEQQMIDAINHFRAAHGLPALSVNSNLEDKARLWATWMSGGGCGPGAGGGPTICHSDVTNGITVKWTVLEENVGAATPKTNVTGLESGFEHSKEHAANMLNPKITTIGLGAAYSAHTLFVAEEFMAP
jgi:uncharacterized protein YkwD